MNIWYILLVDANSNKLIIVKYYKVANIIVTFTCACKIVDINKAINIQDIILSIGTWWLNKNIDSIYSNNKYEIKMTIP